MVKGMTTMLRTIFGAAVLALAAGPAAAQDMSAFHGGPVFADFGKFADVDSQMPIPKGTVFKVLFDDSKGADAGKPNRTVDRVARYINMSAAAGVPEADIHAALVVHGGAVWDVTTDAAYGAKHDGQPNPSGAMVRALLAHGVQIYVCGQAAASRGVANADLIPGVKMALSAITAETLLQQQGYVLVP